MTRRLLCAGEVVVDLVLTVPALPPRGGDVIAATASSQVGGAFNVMTAAARQDTPVTYAGLLGTGPLSSLATDGLRAERIEVALPPRPDRDLGTVVALVEPDGERTFITSLGAEADLRHADLGALAVSADDVVYVSGYGLAYPANGPCLARWVPTLPPSVTVVLDPGPLVGAVPADVLAPVVDRVDWLSCNVAEARIMVDDDRADSAALITMLRERVHVGVVLRQGSMGAVVATYDSEPLVVPAPAVHVVDTSGAGDAHVGSFIASLARPEDFDPGRATGHANAAAALAVARSGPATAPTTSQLNEFLSSTGRGDDIG